MCIIMFADHLMKRFKENQENGSLDHQFNVVGFYLCTNNNKLL